MARGRNLVGGGSRDTRLLVYTAFYFIYAATTGGDGGVVSSGEQEVAVGRWRVIFKFASRRLIASPIERSSR